MAVCPKLLKPVFQLDSHFSISKSLRSENIGRYKQAIKEGSLEKSSGWEESGLTV